MKIAFKLNGKKVSIDCPEETKLLWALREKFQLTGTKFGCGIAQCGVCTVHLNGNPIRACVMPMSAVDGASVVTIEGLAKKDKLHPLQEAWINEQVPQCGYCQPGQLMQAAALLKANPSPTREEIIEHMNGVICRCGTYHRIVKAIQQTIDKK
ncbi:MAG: (2Fe-2S)-binding protein [Saprospiraceae bacterium]|nr:(2Fe-2S)-binding protein [Saprospiraceae bacterium]